MNQLCWSMSLSSTCYSMCKGKERVKKTTSRTIKKKMDLNGI